MTTVARAEVEGRPRAHVRDRFGLLLAVLVATFIAQGIGQSSWQRVLVGLLQFAALAVSFLATGVVEDLRWLLLLGVAGAGAFGLAGESGPEGAAAGIGSVGAALVLFAMLVSVLVRVLRHRRVTAQTLYGAVCAYLLIGFLFAAIYGAFDGFTPQPLFGRSASRSVYSYFSFVTLTTVGFGDYTVKLSLARRFVAIEAVLGQVFIATTLARLVALYKASPEGPSDDPRPPTASTGSERQP